MADLQRQLLDELMGSDRNLHPEDQTEKRRTLTDDLVDKYSLCGCSPYDLFRNTKSDMVRATFALLSCEGGN
jgi:hypothetical protein